MKVFEYRGLKCLLRSGGLGIPLGYVQPPLDWSGDSYELEVHGGVTWDGENEANGPGRWIGFDAGHAGDSLPMIYAMIPGASKMLKQGLPRDDDYMEAECKRLADQILDGPKP